jgi:hypothetical protein
MFTKEPARETPEQREAPLLNARFPNFTYNEDVENSISGLKKSKTQEMKGR